MSNLLLDAILPNWVVHSFPIIKFILLILIVLASIALIVVILCQESEDSSSNAITGIKESYYAQNKGASKEGRLKRVTIILSIFIAVAVILFFILTEIYGGSLWSAIE